MRPGEISYVLPIRCDLTCSGHDELARSLRVLQRAGVEVIVADGSEDQVRAGAHRADFGDARRVDVSPREGANGKVAGVHAGVLAATRERVVVADDDVRYDVELLSALAAELEGADLAVPQNYFRDRRWHTVWDGGRSLLARAIGHDYPGTLAVRRSWFARAGGYDDEVLFENLELIRTVRATEGVVRWAPWILVPRTAPAASTFLDQRVRQAYDDLAQPGKLAAMLALAPAGAFAARRNPRSLALAALVVVGLAEVGRRRHGAADRFPITSSLAAPLWLTERAACSWIAVGLRVLRGGVRYRGGRLRTAAHPGHELRRRWTSREVPHHVHRRTVASSANGHNDIATPLDDAPRRPARPRRAAPQARARAGVRLGTP